MKTQVFAAFCLVGGALASCARPLPPANPTIIVVESYPGEGGCSKAPVAAIAAPPVATIEEPTMTGLQGKLYLLPSGTSKLPDFSRLQPEDSFFTTRLDVTGRESHMGFPGVGVREEWFGIDYQGVFSVAVPGEYRFRLTADDGAELYIDGEKLISNDGIHPPVAKETTVFLSKGAHKIRVPYFQGPRYHIALVLEVAEPGESFSIFDLAQPLGKSR